MHLDIVWIKLVNSTFINLQMKSFGPKKYMEGLKRAFFGKAVGCALSVQVTKFKKYKTWDYLNFFTCTGLKSLVGFQKKMGGLL